jgi:hypothetical protein
MIAAGIGVGYLFHSGKGAGLLIGMGIIMLIMSGPSSSEKNGYHF